MTDFEADVLRIAKGCGALYLAGAEKRALVVTINETLAFARAMCRYQAAKDAEICRQWPMRPADGLTKECDECAAAIEKAAGEL